MRNSNEVLWLISKYAVSQKYGNATRQYFLSLNFSKKGISTSLISSQSSNIKNYEKINKYYKLEQDGLFKHYLLAGPKINLGFSFVRIWSWIVFEINLFRLVFWNTKLEKPTIILVSSLSLLSFISGVLLKWKYGAKLVLEVRDIWPKSLIEVGEFSKFNPFVILLMWVEKFGYINADAIVGTMPNLLEHIKEITNKDVPIYYIPQGFEHTQVFSHLQVDALNKLKMVSLTEFNIIYSGTIGKSNRVELILLVAQKLEIIAPNIHFYIMGDGPLKDRLKLQYSNLSNVTFFDSIEYNEVPTFLSKFDLLIYPVGDFSIYRFGISPNKIIDYMRSGRPILTIYSGYPSLIQGTKYSFNVGTENIDTLVSEVLNISNIKKEILDSLGENAKRTVERYHTFDRLSNKYLDLFNDIK